VSETTEIGWHYKFDFEAELTVRNKGISSLFALSQKTVWESFMIKPNGRLVLVSFTRYRASTSSLLKS
jgi:hypothetical protein